MFQFVIKGGVTILGKCDIHLEITYSFTERFNPYGRLSFHTN